MSGIAQAFFTFGSGGGGTIAFESVGTAATGSDPIVPLPGTFSTGDLLILVVNTAAASVSSTPSGWTAITLTPVNPRLYIYYKIAGASESAVTVSTGAATNTLAVMLAYTRNTATPFDVSSALATGAGSVATPSITTTAANDVVISFYSGPASSTWTATPSSTTTRFNGVSTSAILVCDETQVAAGATTSRTATNSAGTTITCAAVAFKSL